MIASAPPTDAALIAVVTVAPTSAPSDAAAITIPEKSIAAVDAGAASHATNVATGSATVHPVQRVPRVPAPKHEQGALSVSCDPWCEIWIDGPRRASTVSKRFTLTVGVHTVRLVYPDTKSELTKKVEISSTPQIIEQTW